MNLSAQYGPQFDNRGFEEWTSREKYEENGKNQLTDYLAIRGLEEGYLVSFDFSKKKRVLQQSKPQWIECQGKRIFEVVV